MELGFLDFLQDFILQIYTATIFKEATHHINTSFIVKNHLFIHFLNKNLDKSV